MGRKRFKSFLALVLALTLVCMSIPEHVQAQEPEADGFTVQAGLEELSLKKDAVEYLLEQMKLGSASTEAKEEEYIDIIVEMEGGSLLDYYNLSGEMLTYGVDADNTANMETTASADIAIDDFMNTETAVSLKEDILNEQQEVLDLISTISSQITSGSNMKARSTAASEVLYQYTTVMNGFAMRIQASMLNTIKLLPGVKNVFRSTVYEIDHPEMTSSVDTIGATSAWDLDLKGEGMLVAVIDTGLDTNHIGFSTEPSGAKLTKDTVEQKIQEGKVQEGVYISAKIPFAYDYADSDNDVNPTESSITDFGNDHGTHVAGTVAADGGLTSGVAPKAQLVILKVGSDNSGGIETTDIIAALEDAVNLGVDAVNISIGSPAGFSYSDEETMEAVYSRISAAGINVAVSQGNNYSSNYMNTLNSHSLTQNPDTGVGGSPSSLTGSTAVASVVNTTYRQAVFMLGETPVGYIESAEQNQPKFIDLITEEADTFSYIAIPNYGAAADYEGLNVEGSIVLVSRGEITFNEKVTAAAAAGAIGIIVYNNQLGTIKMSIQDYLIPAVAISMTDGQLLLDAETPKITILQEEQIFNSENANEPSDFSSWGVTLDLGLKPDIAAPGENIYSTIPFNSYATFNGTSMASPHIAGSYALVKQYIKSNPYFIANKAREKGYLATQLLMSTAKPAINKEGVTYSPRKQGSGIVNVYNAINTGAYLYVDDSSIDYRPKLNLGDDVSRTGIYTGEFILKSIADYAQTFVLDFDVLTETVINDETYGEAFIGEQAYDITNCANVTAMVDGTQVNEVTVEPFGEVTISVTITIDETVKQYLNQNFRNGEFVDGYVYLNNDNGVDLAIPFLAFYGDWTRAAIFDESTIYDNNLFGTGNNQVYSQDSTLLMSDSMYLGVNPFDSWAYTLLNNKYSPYDYAYYYYNEMLHLDPDKIAISPNDDGYMDMFYRVNFSMLRNADTFEAVMTAGDGSTVYSWDAVGLRKSFYYSSAQTMNSYYSVEDWAPETPVNNDVYTFTLKADMNYAGHETNNVRGEVSFPITIDLEGPKALTAELYMQDDHTYITFTAADNQYISAAFLGLIDEEGSVSDIVDTKLINESEKAAVSTFTYDITNYVSGGFANIAFMLVDYAMNETDYGFSFSVPDQVVLNETEALLNISDTIELTASVYAGETLVADSVVWTSSDETVATVSENGLVTGIAKGTAVITAKTWSGASAICNITVENMIPKIDKAFYSLEEGEEAVIGLTGIGRNTTVTYKSTSPRTASVNEDGVITANKAGVAMITVIVNQNNKITKFYISVIVVKAPSVSIIASKTTIGVRKTTIFLPKLVNIIGTYTWSSSNNKIAKVGKHTGIVMGIKKGTATITLTAKTIDGKVLTATQDITVK